MGPTRRADFSLKESPRRHRRRDALVRLELHARAHVPRLHGSVRAARAQHDLIEEIRHGRHRGCRERRSAPRDGRGAFFSHRLSSARRSLPDFHLVGIRMAEESPPVFSGGSANACPGWRGVFERSRLIAHTCDSSLKTSVPQRAEIFHEKALPAQKEFGFDFPRRAITTRTRERDGSRSIAERAASHARGRADTHARSRGPRYVARPHAPGLRRARPPEFARDRGLSAQRGNAEP